MAEGDRVAFWGLSYKGTDAIHEDSTLMTSHLAKAPPPSTITLMGSRFQPGNFEGDIQTVGFQFYKSGMCVGIALLEKKNWQNGIKALARYVAFDLVFSTSAYRPLTLFPVWLNT